MEISTMFKKLVKYEKKLEQSGGNPLYNRKINYYLRKLQQNGVNTSKIRIGGTKYVQKLNDLSLHAEADEYVVKSEEEREITEDTYNRLNKLKELNEKNNVSSQKTYDKMKQLVVIAEGKLKDYDVYIAKLNAEGKKHPEEVKKINADLENVRKEKDTLTVQIEQLNRELEAFKAFIDRKIWDGEKMANDIANEDAVIEKLKADINNHNMDVPAGASGAGASSGAPAVASLPPAAPIVSP